VDNKTTDWTFYILIALACAVAISFWFG